MAKRTYIFPLNGVLAQEDSGGHSADQPQPQLRLHETNRSSPFVAVTLAEIFHLCPVLDVANQVVDHRAVGRV